MTLGMLECKDNNAVCVKGMMPNRFLPAVCLMAQLCDKWLINKYERYTTKRA